MKKKIIVIEATTALTNDVLKDNIRVVAREALKDDDTVDQVVVFESQIPSDGMAMQSFGIVHRQSE